MGVVPTIPRIIVVILLRSVATAQKNQEEKAAKNPQEATKKPENHTGLFGEDNGGYGVIQRNPEEEATKKPVEESNRYVKEDDSKSTYYAQRACYNGLALSCWSTGYAYAVGSGVNKSIPKALFFYKKGCRMGNRKACHYYQITKYQNE